MRTYHYDVVYDETIDGTVTELRKRFPQLEITIYMIKGPSGWPILQFRGKKKHIAEWHRRWDSDDLSTYASMEV